MAIKVDIYHDTRTLRKKTGDYPYKLRVYAGKPKLYPTVLGLSTEDHKKLTAKNLGDRLQQVRDKLRELERTATEAINEMDPFSFEQFEREFLKDHPLFEQTRIKFKPLTAAQKGFDFTAYNEKFPILLQTFDPGTMGEVFQVVIRQHITRNTLGSIKTAVAYQTTWNSFFRFRGNVPIKAVTIGYLRAYSDWLKSTSEDKKRKCGKTTIGIYMRKIRTVFNEAIRLKQIKKENHYPFGRGKYVIPGSQNIKKAMDREEIGQIYYYPDDPTRPAIRRAKSF